MLDDLGALLQHDLGVFGQQPDQLLAVFREHVRAL